MQPPRPPRSASSVVRVLDVDERAGSPRASGRRARGCRAASAEVRVHAARGAPHARLVPVREGAAQVVARRSRRGARSRSPSSRPSAAAEPEHQADAAAGGRGRRRQRDGARPPSAKRRSRVTRALAHRGHRSTRARSRASSSISARDAQDEHRQGPRRRAGAPRPSRSSRARPRRRARPPLAHALHVRRRGSDGGPRKNARPATARRQRAHVGREALRARDAREQERTARGGRRRVRRGRRSPAGRRRTRKTRSATEPGGRRTVPDAAATSARAAARRELAQARPRAADGRRGRARARRRRSRSRTRRRCWKPSSSTWTRGPKRASTARPTTSRRAPDRDHDAGQRARQHDRLVAGRRRVRHAVVTPSDTTRASPAERPAVPAAQDRDRQPVVAQQLRDARDHRRLAAAADAQVADADHRAAQARAGRRIPRA